MKTPVYLGIAALLIVWIWYSIATFKRQAVSPLEITTPPVMSTDSRVAGVVTAVDLSAVAADGPARMK